MNRRSLSHGRKQRIGMTLIEVLVAVAVIAILMGLILPAVQSAREAARRTQCKSRLKQLALAVHNFHDVELAIPAMDLGPGWATWAVLLLPYLEQNNLYAAWDLKKQYFVQFPPQRAGADLPVFHCPSQVRSGTNAPRSIGDTLWILTPSSSSMLGPGPPGWSDFAGVGGTTTDYKNGDGAFRRAVDKSTGAAIEAPVPLTEDAVVNPWRYPVSFSLLNVDGLSVTLLIGEKFLANDTSVFNGQIQPGYVRACGVNFGLVASSEDTTATNGRRFGSAHAGMSHFAFADGHVSSVSTSIDQATLHALAKVADHTVVSGF